MNRRHIVYGVWLVLAACLYFFENNTGSRILLCCSLLLPLIPGLRKIFFSPDCAEARKMKPLTVKNFSYPEDEEAGNIRAYQAGDPVNRIHWKLSAKRNEMLIRETGRETVPEEIRKAVPVMMNHVRKEKRKKRQVLICLGALLLVLLCLVVIPEPRYSAGALCNRLFEASEQINAYLYDRFPVPAGQPLWPALLCLAFLPGLIFAIIILSDSRLPAFCLMAGCVVFQVYFGLAFPSWLNTALFILFALRMAARLRSRRGLFMIPAVILAVSLAVLIIIPGADPATEKASEEVRDILSRMAGRTAGAVQEEPEGENETRHIHSRTLNRGNLEAKPDREYDPETVEEEQISTPRWINYLKMLFLFLAVAALLILPFVPFLLLNARRKKALEARNRFMSDNVSEAICAVFQKIIAWLENTGHGAGNRPYREWARLLSDPFSREYAVRFSLCAGLFEEAAYSSHSMDEDQRQQVLSLLEETEQVLIAKADWRQRLRLKMGGIWIT